MTNWAYREEEEGLFRERKSGRRVGESGCWLGVRGKWERVSGWKKGRQEAAWGIVENRGGVRNMRDVLAKKGAAREFVGYWWAWRLRGKAWGMQSGVVSLRGGVWRMQGGLYGNAR